MEVVMRLETLGIFLRHNELNWPQAVFWISLSGCAQRIVASAQALITLGSLRLRKLPLYNLRLPKSYYQQLNQATILSSNLPSTYQGSVLVCSFSTVLPHFLLSLLSCSLGLSLSIVLCFRCYNLRARARPLFLHWNLRNSTEKDF